MNNTTKLVTLLPIVAIAALSTSALATQDKMQDSGKMSQGMMRTMETKSGTFKGVEVNSGSVTLFKQGNRYHLSVGNDFKIPASPAPHWQVVDAKGNVFLLQRFTIAGDKTNREIVLPSYITSVAKVQVWCSFAEVNLGEASFAKPITLK